MRQQLQGRSRSNRASQGDGSVYVAGGIEVHEQLPFLVPSEVRNSVKMGDMKLVDSMLHDGT